MKSKSFLERIQPSRQRWKMVDWPFPVEGEERPKVKVRVLGQDESEAAWLATVDHFAKRKPKVDFADPVFIAREQAEIVFRAYSADDEPLAADVDELAQQPLSVLNELHQTYMQFYKDVAATPYTSEDMAGLVELVKKNIPVEVLSALPSSWLSGLITTLASQLAASTTANGYG